MTDRNPVHDQLNERLDQLEEWLRPKLESIEEQTTRTNGKVIDLRADVDPLKQTVFGDQIPSVHGDNGLVGMMRQMQDSMNSFQEQQTARDIRRDDLTKKVIGASLSVAVVVVAAVITVGLGIGGGVIG